MRQLRNWFARQRERSREQRRQEIAETFQVREYGETFCIVHNGDAIQDFPVNATISEVLKELRRKRETAVKHCGI